VEHYNYEDERQGVYSLFMYAELLREWRSMTMSTHGTRQDFAQILGELVDMQYPDAENSILVTAL
jgi:hypothetical protein